MPDFKPRKVKFKAWNTSTRLVMRLSSIDCNKGELIKKDHVLLQFTGLCDIDGVEIYDQDVLLISSEKFLVYWNEETNGWYYHSLTNDSNREPFVVAVAVRMKRFCSFFELK
ncbi:MAG: hypothetical protein DI538_08710 [Azospira oryzae]|jgi:hypothetical protein|nr:hypothetical protein [Cytophaga sp.]PZR38808.1 MAG: hypothetical protein DI538_08710 [Azospira oryzae]